MKNKKIVFFFIFIGIFSLSIATSCRKKTNEKLYEESKTADLVFYKSKDTIYGPKGGSPHGAFKLKFNSTAVGVLGADGKLASGSEFPKGSLLVKEVYEGTTLKLYAVMKKDPTSKYASNGWVWAEYKPNGGVEYDISKTGSACTSCHSNSPARDLTRSFDLH